MAQQTLYKRGRIYFSYGDSTAETTAGQGVWQRFPVPSVPITTYRSSGDFTVTDMAITYIRDIPAWFNVETVCNIYKGSGGNASRNVEVVWHLNGSPAGPVRGSHMSAQESQIITGSGQIYLSTGDILEPMIRNIDNGDFINIKNCVFNITEDSDWGH